MARFILIALVGVWLFNLARLIAGGIPGNGVQAGDAFAAPPVVAAQAFDAAPRPLPDGVALAVRSASLLPGTQSSISVALTLAEPSIVELDVYDSSGRCILTQTSRRLPAGRSRVQLQSIERLNAGRYWVRARVGDQVATTPVAAHG